MVPEPFAEGASPIHRIDPRARILVAAGFSVLIALAQGFRTLVPGLGMALVLTVLARLEVRSLLHRLAVLAGFMGLLWVVLPLTYPGVPVWRLGSLVWTQAGVLLAARITLKAVTLLLMLIALVATMPLATFGYALHELRVPQKIVHLLLITYRYVFVLDQEYQRLLTAAKIRGFKPQTNLHTYRTFAYLVGMLLVRASLRAQRVHQAMVCRGFKGRFYTLHELGGNGKTRFFAGSMILALAGLFFLEWVLPGR
jgi:cobalt/nickel transport system permease protein